MSLLDDILEKVGDDELVEVPLDEDDDVEHYGVLGMKWGVRKRDYITPDGKHRSDTSEQRKSNKIVKRAQGEQKAAQKKVNKFAKTDAKIAKNAAKKANYKEYGTTNQKRADKIQAKRDARGGLTTREKAARAVRNAGSVSNALTEKAVSKAGIKNENVKSFIKGGAVGLGTEKLAKKLTERANTKYEAKKAEATKRLEDSKNNVERAKARQESAKAAVAAAKEAKAAQQEAKPAGKDAKALAKADEKWQKAISNPKATMAVYNKGAEALNRGAIDKFNQDWDKSSSNKKPLLTDSSGNYLDPKAAKSYIDSYNKMATQAFQKAFDDTYGGMPSGSKSVVIEYDVMGSVFPQAKFIDKKKG